MTPLLLAPTDVLRFRTTPSAQWPLPSTVQEHFRRALLEAREPQATGHAELESLELRGPLPWHPKHGVLYPIPLDASKTADGIRHHRLMELPAGDTNPAPGAFAPPCLPAPSVAPAKEGVLTGWWTAEQPSNYLAGSTRFNATPIPSRELWTEEARMGVARPSAGNRRLFATRSLRLNKDVRIAIQAGLPSDLSDGEEAGAWEALLQKGQMLLGGDRRLVQIERRRTGWPVFEKPAPGPWEGPFHVRWTLLTPAIFLHGSLPGWCRSTLEKHPFPDGQVCLREAKNRPFLRAHLVAHHLGEPMPVAGWDPIANRPKPTQLAVPAGSVYHFLCPDAPTATRLVNLLHDSPRSDLFAEHGWGHGLCAKPELIPPALRALGEKLFRDAMR